METRVSSHVGFEWYPISSMSSRGILQNAPITQRGSPGNSEIDDHGSPSLTIPLWCPLPCNWISVTIETPLPYLSRHLDRRERVDTSKQIITQSPVEVVLKVSIVETTETTETTESPLGLVGLHILLHVSERVHVRNTSDFHQGIVPLLLWCWPQASYFGFLVLPLIDDTIGMNYTFEKRKI
jgi:hypothetical protein